MYILKNAFLSITRNKGRNVLICLIITAITIASCVAININKSGKNLLKNYINSNPLEVSFRLDMASYRNTSDSEKETLELLNIDKINEIGKISTVIDYYYLLETSLNSSTITAISNNTATDNSNTNNQKDMPEKENKIQSGDFRLTAYSDISYNEDFINGTKKIKEGTMIDKNSTDMIIAISEELAEENNLSIGDKISFTDTDDETITYDFKIVGIFSTTSEDADNFMNINAMNSENQLYSNITSINKILANKDTNLNNISAKFYINNKDISKFESSIKKIEISDYYQMTTNSDEIKSTLNPIESISNFSSTFLLVVIIVGIIVLVIINLLNIRERKYEIGVLRAIGMTKFKTTIQLLTETLIITLFALIIGSGIGTFISQPISNSMLKNEIENYQNKSENTTNNFGGQNFERPGFNQGSNSNKNNQIKKPGNNIEYVDKLKVKTDLYTFIELFGVGLLLTLTSGIVAIMFVNKYEPNKILQNRG